MNPDRWLRRLRDQRGYSLVEMLVVLTIMGTVTGALTTIFEDLGRPEDLSTDAPRRPAGELIRRLSRLLPADIYRWTGHFPERTRVLLRHMAGRADALAQVYPEDRERPATIALTTLVTALAMNHVHRGSYMP